ncbi:hypothetical protein ACLB2K_071949 [Fragaria x ananassa]
MILLPPSPPLPPPSPPPPPPLSLLTPTVYSPHPTVYSPPPRALLSLKSSLDDPDSRLSSWTPNTSHCTWAGVTCDSQAI